MCALTRTQLRGNIGEDFFIYLFLKSYLESRLFLLNLLLQNQVKIYKKKRKKVFALNLSDMWDTPKTAAEKLWQKVLNPPNFLVRSGYGD